jgi:hypothetical protein
MKKVVDLEEYREKKRKEIDNTNEIPELSEEDFEEFLEYEKEIGLVFNDYYIYGDHFIRENADHLAHHTAPFCTICDSYLEEGDRVDKMWPLEYGHNVCQDCESRLPKKVKKEKIVNLNKIKLVIVEEDFQKIKGNLSEDDIFIIKGNKIIAEKLFKKIKYQIIGMEDDLRL